MTSFLQLRFFLIFSIFLGLSGAGFSKNSYAQKALPELPAPIQNLVDEGAQIRYLGKDHGLDAWLTIKQGQEQYFYVLPDGKAFLMGVLFDETGKLVTVRQVQKLRGEDGTILDSLTQDSRATNSLASDMPGQNTSEAFQPTSPSERLFRDIESSNWVPLGKPGSPVAYAFIDPQCPHCHTLISQLREGQAFENGQIQLRAIPVGFREETRAQAAFLIAAPNAQERFFSYLDGDVASLPAKSDINQQGVQRNLAVMQSWKLDVTPLLVYRDKNNQVKIIRGNPKDMRLMLNDLGMRE